MSRVNKQHPSNAFNKKEGHWLWWICQLFGLSTYYNRNLRMYFNKPSYLNHVCFGYRYCFYFDSLCVVLWSCVFSIISTSWEGPYQPILHAIKWDHKICAFLGNMNPYIWNVNDIKIFMFTFFLFELRGLQKIHHRAFEQSF